MDYPALALLEFKSIAEGIEAGDAMVKRSPVAYIHTGTVQPGHYLVLVAGDVASVEEAVEAGQRFAHSDLLFLPNVHPAVLAALSGERNSGDGDALGIIETHTVASAILAADAGVKGADVSLLQLRLADGLGGKGILFFNGLVSDVQTAVSIAAESAQNQLLRQSVIPQLHGEMWANVNKHGRFGAHFNWEHA